MSEHFGRKSRKRRKIPLLVKAGFLLAILLALLQYLSLRLTHMSSNTHLEESMIRDSLQKVAKESNEEAKPIAVRPDEIPQWIQHYLQWHGKMRSKFQDSELIDNKESPGVLVVGCVKSCGGLYDRLNSLARWLLVANRTERVLLYKWIHPAPLELFLAPNTVNWTAPSHSKLGRKAMRQQGNARYWWNEVLIQHPDIHERPQSTKCDDCKPIIDQRPPISPKVFQELLVKMGETDMVDDTPTFSRIFRAFFRPTEALQMRINYETNKIGLVKGEYLATHCRVRHPGRYGLSKVIEGKVNGTEADETGLPWTGIYKASAIASASRALQCTDQLAKGKDEPIFFYSDSEDLVHHVHNGSILSQKRVDNELIQRIKKKRRVVSREIDHPAVHIDRESVGDPSVFYDTFVDLYIAVGARCVSMGVGNFAYLAAKISGTTCLQYHERITKRAGKIWNQNRAGDPCTLVLRK